MAGNVDRLHTGDVDGPYGAVDSHGKLARRALDAHAHRGSARGTKGERLSLALQTRRPEHRRVRGRKAWHEINQIPFAVALVAWLTPP